MDRVDDLKDGMTNADTRRVAPRMVQGALYKRGAMMPHLRSRLAAASLVARLALVQTRTSGSSVIKASSHPHLGAAGHTVKAWKQRYFILQPGPTPCLMYYRNTGEPPANTLALKGANVTVRQLDKVECERLSRCPARDCKSTVIGHPLCDGCR